MTNDLFTACFAKTCMIMASGICRALNGETLDPQGIWPIGALSLLRHIRCIVAQVGFNRNGCAVRSLAVCKGELRRKERILFARKGRRRDEVLDEVRSAMGGRVNAASSVD